MRALGPCAYSRINVTCDRAAVGKFTWCVLVVVVESKRRQACGGRIQHTSSYKSHRLPQALARTRPKPPHLAALAAVGVGVEGKGDGEAEVGTWVADDIKLQHVALRGWRGCRVG